MHIELGGCWYDPHPQLQENKIKIVWNVMIISVYYKLEAGAESQRGQGHLFNHCFCGGPKHLKEGMWTMESGSVD